MKKLITIILILFTQLCFAEIALYTTENKTPHAVSEMTDILEKFLRENPEKNIVFYVHGRSHTMEKEWNKLPVLESKYNIKVVMLHWESWTSMLSRPVKHSEEAAPALAEAFQEIQKFRDSHQDTFETKKITLLCHSMGNLVLKNFVEQQLPLALNSNLNDHPIFDNYVSAGADVPLIDHHKWLSQIKFAKKKYIMMNNRDIVLLFSYFLDLKVLDPNHYKLGLGFDNFQGKEDQIKEKLSIDTTYVDLSHTVKADHGYFVGRKPLTLNIFDHLLNGEVFVIDPQALEKAKLTRENNIFYVRD